MYDDPKLWDYLIYGTVLFEVLVCSSIVLILIYTIVKSCVGLLYKSFKK